ncbi:eCIS core domain-containing protein [Rhizocola hellebori]|nr:DUF4157 domain-containing protein [Rhizocola hellebori]
MGVASGFDVRPESSEPERRLDVSHGHPVDHEIRRSMESRFRFDFSTVRIFADERAGEAVDALDARAVTIGSSILFGRGEYAPHTHSGKSLLAHELAHVVQASGPTDRGSNVASAEADADQAAQDAMSGRQARPSVSTPATPHFKLRKPGKVKDGEYTVEMDENPGSAGLQERVRIEFMPDKAGPVTDTITFLQVAQTLVGGKARPWKELHKDQAIVDRIRTKQANRIHETKQGDTLASVSTAHYGLPSKAAAIYDANQGLGISSDPKAPLAAGQLLTVPDAVQGDYSLDIDAANTKPRQPGGPNVSGNYPHLEFRNKSTPIQNSGGLTLSSATPGRAVGRNPVAGPPESAIMNDLPGGGPYKSTFRFETTAHAEDIGHYYGAVHWGFDYDPSNTGSATPTPHITNEFAEFAPNVSDTMGAAVVAFNKDVGNRHVVQEGETLRAISLMYFKTSNRAFALFSINPGILATFDADASLPPGKELNLPTQWDVARYGAGGVKPSAAEQDTVWDRIRRAAPR